MKTATMTYEDWKKTFDEVLRKDYLISIEDAGLDDHDLQRWREGNENEPRVAVLEYAEKYGLDPVSHLGFTGLIEKKSPRRQRR